MATTWTYAGQNATLGGLTSPIPSSGSATSNLNDGSSSTYEGYSSVSLPDHRVIGFITWDEDIHLEAIAASAVCWHVSGGGTGAYQIDYATSTSGSTWTTLASGAMAVETAASVAAAIGEGLSADGAGVLANRIRVVVQHTTATEGGAALRELTAFRAGEAGCSAPATPAGLAWSGLCEGDQVTLYWNASVDADGYVLKVDGGEEIDVGNVTSYALTSGITAGTDYDITIAAYNDCGTSAYTGTAVVVSPCDPDCDEPVGPYTPPSESPRVTTILSSRAGVRKTLPGHHVQKCAWSEERYGGFTRFDVTLAITPEELVAYGTTLELSDRVEFWWNGTEGSVNTRYFRGYVHTIAHAEGEPYTITLSGHGLSMRAGQCVVDESYLYPSPADISVPFASLVNDHVIPILSPDFTTLVVSAADVDATVQVVESTNKQFGDVINNLTQQQGANLSLWGYDVSSDGDDRLYLKPFGTAIAYTLAVPGLNTVAARGDRSDAELVNDLTIVGGNPRFPNLVYNSSFERPRFGGDGTGNLIPNGGFETTSDWSGTGSYKSSGASTGEGSAYAGSRMYETDNSGEYAQQTVNPPSTAIVVGNDYVFSCQAKCEDESVAVTGLITLTWLTSGGSTISTVTQALDTPTGASVTKLQSAWQQYTFTSRAPATAAGFKIRIETDSGGGIEQGILWDALELYDASVVYQDGWELVADGTAVINSVNWQAQDPRGAADGNYALYVDVSASDADANEARLQPVGQQKLQIDGGGAYTISLALLSPPGVTANGKMQLVIKEFKSDGSAVGSPTTYTIAAGSGWTSWTRVSTTRTADQRSSHFLVYLAFRGNSQVLIDAFAVRDSTVSSEYIRDGSLTLHYDTDSADLPDLSAAAQDSIADYGRRPGIVTVDTITTTADAIAYATAYFNAYAIAFPSPAIEVVNPYQYFRTGELVKLVGPDGADMMGDETSLPIVRASWSWDGLLKCSLELKKERPDLVSLLLRKLKRALGASYSSSSIAGSPPSTVGSGTVTSVGLTMPSAEFNVAGSPVTDADTLVVTWDNQSANTGLMGPTSGGAGGVGFRAFVSDDIPSLAISKIAAAAGSRLFGRYTGSAGAGQEISIGPGLSLDTGTGVLSNTGAAGVLDGDYGDITVSSSGAVWTIDANAVSNAKLRQSAGLSVIGRSANTTGDVADITAGTDGHVLRLSGTTLGFGTVATAGIADDAVTYAKIQNVSATDRLLGRDTAGAGDIEELTVGGGVEFTGTGIQRSALTGDVTASAGSNSTTIATNAVTDAKFRQSAGISVVGRSANTTGNVADITAVTDGHALRLSGTTLGFGTIATAGIADAAVTDAKLRNSAALSVIGRASNSSGAPADIAAGANGNLLRRASNALAFGTISLADSNSVTTPGSNNEVFYRSGGVLGSSAGFTYDGSALYVSGDLQVQSDLYLGRVSPTQITADQNNYSSTTDNFCWRISSDAPRSITGLSTSTPSVSIMGKTFALLNVGSYDITLVNESASSTAANRFSFGADLTIGPGESALIWYDPDSTRWRLLAHSVAPGAAGVSDGDKGDITVSSSGAVWTIDANVVTDAKFRQGAALSVVGVTGNATANVADIAAGTDHQVLRRSGTALAFGAVNLAQSAAVTGALAIGNGGTGQTTQTAAFDALAPTTTKGDLIVSNGTDNIRLAVGTNNYVLTADSAEASGVKWAAAAGGGTPAGSDTYLQYNASGAFGAEAALAYDYTNNQLSAPGLTVTEDFVLSGDITPTQITATQNDYSPTGYATASVFRLSSDAARSITGIAGGADGRFLVVLNVGSYTITFENADTGSTAANRFSMGSDLALEAGQGCILLYDSTQSRWTLATPRLSTTAPFAIDYIGTTGDANYNYCRVYIVTDSTSTQSIGADFAAQGGGLAIVRNKKASGSLTVDASSGWNMADGNTTLAVGESAIYQIGQLGGSGTNIILTLLKTASGSSPAGSSAQIQYNDSGSFGAEAGFEYDAANNQATIPGLTVTQDVALSGDITPSQITSNQNDYAPTDHATTTRWRLSSDAARTITGIAGGADGRILILSNVGSYPITLADDADTSSSAANRLDLGGSDYRIAPSQTIFLCYDSTLSRWTLLDTPARVHYLEYTAAGTTSSISIPTWATKMHVSACGGGGGGGGGARNDTSGANCTGGGGGGGAGVVNTHIHDVAALLAVATTFDVTVGAGGTGGAGATNGAGAAGSNGSGGGNSRVTHNSKYIAEAIGANAGSGGQNGATGGTGATALSVNQVQNQWSVNAGANGGSGDGNGSNAVNNANNPGSGGGGGSLGAGNATKTGGNGGRGHLTFGGISRTAASGGSGNGDPGDAASTSNFLRGQFGDGGGGGASHPSGVGGDGGAGFRGGGGGGGGAGRGGNGGAGGNGGDGYVLLVFTK